MCVCGGGGGEGGGLAGEVVVWGSMIPRSLPQKPGGSD